MSTKGASNRFGNTRGGRPGYPTQHTGFPWAKGFNKRTLQRHFRDHGEQMKAPTPESYAAKAVTFANTIDRKNNISFVAKNGTTYKYNKRTGIFAVVIKKGVVVTFFRPKEGIRYYYRQIKKDRSASTDEN